MKNILLIGLGRFGKHIAIQSSQLGHEIMAVDLDGLQIMISVLLRSVGIFKIRWKPPVC